MSENLRAYTKTLYTLDAVVRRVDDDAWDNQSPNEDWSARQTLGHVIWGMRALTAGIQDDERPAEQAEAEVAGDDPAATWADAFDTILDALDHQGVLQKKIQSPFGEMTVDQAIGTFLMDPLTHAWDIAKAAGIDPALPASLARRALAVLAPLGDGLRRPGVMGDEVEVGDDASDVDAFIAYTGRQP